VITRVEAIFLGVAAAAHVAALYGATLFPNVNRLLIDHGTTPTALEFEFESRPVEERLDVEEIEETPTQLGGRRIDAPVNPDEPERAKRRGGLKGRGAAGTNGVDGPDGDEGPGDGGGDETDPGSKRSSDDWSDPDADGPPGPGDSAWMGAYVASLGDRGAPAETQTPKARTADAKSVNKALKDEIRKNDKKLGLGLPAAGTVASIFKATVQGSDAPNTANASFSVVLGPGGKVQSVKFLSASAGTNATWEGVARSVKAALASQKLTLTGDYVRGANIAINVVSKMQMPSGAKVGAGLELSLTQSFDVADIGSSPVRVVSASASATPIN
jgi:hypothetical protein